ncbi:MAG: MoxR family ATPase [Chloroflexota bacterium]
MQSIDGLTAAFREQGYIAERSLATTVFLALELGRPLLLEGEAGVGKTELAKVLAASLGARLIRLQCYEGLDVEHRGLRVEPPRQMLEIRLLEARGEIDKASAHDIFSSEFLLKRPLLQALEATDGVPPVLLIDEIGRADRSSRPSRDPLGLPGDRARDRDDPEPTSRAPRVVLTSNRTREVHDALKRRCLYHWIDCERAQGVRDRLHPGPGRSRGAGARRRRVPVHRLRQADLTRSRAWRRRSTGRRPC